MWMQEKLELNFNAILELVHNKQSQNIFLFWEFDIINVLHSKSSTLTCTSQTLHLSTWPNKKFTLTNQTLPRMQTH